MLINSKCQITRLDFVEDILPLGVIVPVDTTELGRVFIFLEISSMAKILPKTLSDHPCECGCGKFTFLTTKKDKRSGTKAGEPNRFIIGHSSWKGGIRKSGDGKYDITYLPSHPRAASNGYVLSHILKAEHALGKPLPKGAEVHHHTEIQLVICQDGAYHQFLHRRARALEHCGNPNWRKCWICKQYDATENMSKRKNENSYYHVRCQNKRGRERYAKIQGGNVRQWSRDKVKCSIQHCDRPAQSLGLCILHYGRIRRGISDIDRPSDRGWARGKHFSESHRKALREALIKRWQNSHEI